MRSYLTTVTILALALCASLARADVSHLGYNRSGRPASTRLQRLENNVGPYPAAGYRPNREFNLPREQPLFPLGQQQPQDNKPNNNGGFDVLSEPQQPQRPQLTYGAPAQFRQALGRLQQQQQPQQLYGAPQVQSNQQAQPQNNNGGFDNLSEPQRPNVLYGAPAQFRQAPARLQQQQQQQPQQLYSAPQPQTNQQAQPQNNNGGFDNLSEPQRPNVLYGAPAQFRQSSARLQQQLQLQQLYAGQQAERLTAAKAARLTDNREDKEEEEDNTASTTNNAETSADIDTDNKKDEEKKAEAPQNVATIAYYPAGAFGFVQPVSAAYVAAAPSAAYVTAPSAYQSPYFAASSFVQQPYTFAAPAQLQAW